MDTYKDDVKLELTERIKLTKEVKLILKKAKSDFLKSGRRISMSKIVCNLIIQNYGLNPIHHTRTTPKKDRGVASKYSAKTQEVKTDQDTR